MKQSHYPLKSAQYALLRSLNYPEANIDKQWVDVARSRLSDIRAGNVATVSSEQVFANPVHAKTAAAQ